ncbi:Polyphenol oxidase [Theobroma cacao]|nr:Polyphenol oxidase [Theobroma cacao]
MPAMYTNTKSSLYDQLRDRNRYPPALVDYNGTEETTTDKDQTTSNLRVMNRQMISNGKTTKVFLGSPYRTGDEPDPGAGSLEDIPHGTIHNWSKKEKEEEEEILIIETIELERDSLVKFDVYVNDEDDLTIGPEYTELAGSFMNVPHKHKHEKRMKICLRLRLTDLLEDLGAEDDDSVVVTLVPRKGKGVVTVGGIKIEFAQD